MFPGIDKDHNNIIVIEEEE